MFNDIYQNRRVFLTGDTGFKGSWLRLWLESMGADVYGYSLAPNTQPNHFELLGYKRDKFNDILDVDSLQKAFADFQPEIVFHLAAQPLVRLSYQQPVETFATNLMGTVNVLEACRQTPSVKAIVAITTDKCYENKEQIWGYRESDPMGGYDPYSASKGCAELAISAWRRSFFSADGSPLLASARAGNVIGGGDWSVDRLIPDIVKATSKGETVSIRSPHSTRPWQHVLEPLRGYLMLGQKLLEGNREFAQAWNFGPSDGVRTVLDCVTELQKNWSEIRFEINEPKDAPHEAQNLTLDCTKANAILGWNPVWNTETALQKTAQWYRAFYETSSCISSEQMLQFIHDCEQRSN